MSTSAMIFSLVVVTSGALIIALFFIKAQHRHLRPLERPTRKIIPTRLAKSAYPQQSLTVPAPDQASGAARELTAIRVLPARESGLPYASRSS
jgi:hypothetical protein